MIVEFRLFGAVIVVASPHACRYPAGLGYLA
jgi:hypothetical protein